MLQAPSYFCARLSEQSDPVQLCPAIFMLVMNPQTYNYLFIQFHWLRMAPSVEAVHSFFSAALTYLRRNLALQDNTSKEKSIEEIIEDFYTCVESFLTKYKKEIDGFSFSEIQETTAVIGEPQIMSISADADQIVLDQAITTAKQSGEVGLAIDAILSERAKPLTPVEVKAQLQNMKEAFSAEEEKAMARQLVVSLDIIYLVSDAIRIVLSNNQLSSLISNKEKANQIRLKLRRIDTYLVNKVYSGLGENEIGVLERREKIGIETRTLSDQEAQEAKEEALRNKAFFAILRDAISDLVAGVETIGDVNELIRKKTQIKDEIMRFPDCDEKSQCVDWLDSISERICKAITMLVSKQTDDYHATKHEILARLGLCSGHLPASTVDSLTTAEILYSRYAKTDFADQGFDYSCISALYFQAFEDAYNELIWRGYADKLNSTFIEGRALTSILYDFRFKVLPMAATGFLMDDDKQHKQRDFYIQYNRHTTCVSSRCMYKSFAILMEYIRHGSSLPALCEYFASLCGFDKMEDMLSNKTFMEAYARFSSNITRSAENRNNASHGGTYVSITQCGEDKKTVLNDLEEVRASSIGLIQQMLYLLFDQHG